jgi:hypothetical protein
MLATFVRAAMKVFEGQQFLQLPDDVQFIFETSGPKSFFNLPGWYRLIAEHGLDSGSQAGLAIDSDTGVALAYRRTPHERSLGSCTNLYSCEFDVLGDHANAAAIRDLARQLVSSARPLDSVRWEGLDPASLHFAALLEGSRAAGLAAKPYYAWPNWYERTLGIDFGQYLSTRPSVLRNTWKRKRTALERSATADYRFHKQGEDPGLLTAVYEVVRERSWKAAEPFPAFIPGLIRLAAGLGALRFGILTIDGEPAAAQFWLVWGGRATIYKLVYADKFVSFSPGTLLTMEMMRIVLEEDRPFEIDFGRGDDEYKKLWLGSRRERWGIEAANPRTWRGLAHAVRIQAAIIRDKMNPQHAMPRTGAGKNFSAACLKVPRRYSRTA